MVAIISKVRLDFLDFFGAWNLNFEYIVLIFNG